MVTTYLEIIREVFLERRAANITYTLRQFANDLGIKERHLSKILAGDKGLSKQNAFIVGRRLGLGLREAKEFRFLVSAESGRSRYERNLASQWLQKKSSAAEKKAFGLPS
jgi:plasmid maintenance system antidote protein VapI